MEVAAEYAALIPTIAAHLKRCNSSRDALILVNGLVYAQVGKLRAAALICGGTVLHGGVSPPQQHSAQPKACSALVQVCSNGACSISGCIVTGQ